MNKKMLKEINCAGGGLLLKPCPICGEPVTLSYSFSWGKKYPVIQCEHCHLQLN